MGYVDRHKGARNKASAGLRLSEMRTSRDVASLMKSNDTSLRRSEELSKLEELLRVDGLPEAWAKCFKSWKKWLLDSGEQASLSARDHATVDRKHFRYVVNGNKPIPEGWKPKPEPRHSTKRPIADFLRDPSLLPKKPPGRST